MKHLLVISMMFSLAVPAYAFPKGSKCAERQTDLFMEADAITIYHSEFNTFLKSVKKIDQEVVFAEYQEDLDRRIVDLEKANDQFVVDCVQ
ncbi:hypothetical protein D3C87_1364170 [compost metagenome]